MAAVLRMTCNRTMRLLTRFLKDESGQDMARYAIIALLIALAVILAVPRLREEIDNLLYSIGDRL